MTEAEAKRRRGLIKHALTRLSVEDLTRVAMFGPSDSDGDRPWQVRALSRLIREGILSRFGPVFRPRYHLVKKIPVDDKLLAFLIEPDNARDWSEVVRASDAPPVESTEPTPAPPAVAPVTEPAAPPPTPNGEGADPPVEEMLAALVKVLPLLIEAVSRIERRLAALAPKIEKIYDDLS
jgi:hypothetical protein